MLYKNISRVQKAFHNVKFKPGETKEVSGYINDPDFKRVYKKPSTPSSKPEAHTTVVKEKDTKQEVKVDGSDNSK